MTIPGSLPPASRGLQRAALSYGVMQKPVALPESSAKAEQPDQADALRAILTDEERAYFNQIAALGPITYGPGRHRAAPSDGPRGLRLDVTG